MTEINREQFYNKDGVLVPSRVFRALGIWKNAADAEAALRADYGRQLREALAEVERLKVLLDEAETEIVAQRWNPR